MIAEVYYRNSRVNRTINHSMQEIAYDIMSIKKDFISQRSNNSKEDVPQKDAQFWEKDLTILDYRMLSAKTILLL